MTPADLRERIEMALRARDPRACVTVERATPPLRSYTLASACDIGTADVGATGATAAVALAALAVAVGLDSDGADPRAEVETLRRTLALAQESLAAAVRDERVTVVDEIGRLTRERDEALAVVAGLREEISDAADTLHRLSLAQQRLASQGSEDAQAMGDAYLRAAQIVATVGDPVAVRMEPMTPSALDAAVAAEDRAAVDEPLLDGTDGAHPAWWRGHDRAAEVWRERVATAERERGEAARAQQADFDSLYADYVARGEAIDALARVRDEAIADAAALRAAAGEWRAARSEAVETSDARMIAHATRVGRAAANAAAQRAYARYVAAIDALRAAIGGAP